MVSMLGEAAAKAARKRAETPFMMAVSGKDGLVMAGLSTSDRWPKMEKSTKDT